MSTKTVTQTPKTAAKSMPAQATDTKVVAQAPKAPKALKPNPSANLIGMKIASKDAIKVNFRQGKSNVIECNQVEITAANATGRRLTAIFRDADGKEILTRRIYKEYFERMCDKFGVDL